MFATEATSIDTCRGQGQPALIIVSSVAPNVMPEQSRNNIYALERDLYHGQFCYENDPNFTFEV